MKDIKIRLVPPPDIKDDGCPSFTVSDGVERGSQIYVETRLVFTASAEGKQLGVLGFNEVHHHCTHGSLIRQEKIPIGLETLHIYNYAAPRAQTSGESGRSPSAINGVNISDNGQSDSMHLKGFNRRRYKHYSLDDVFKGLTTEKKLEPADNVMLADNDVPVAVFGDNWIAVTFDIQHSRNNQAKLMAEVVNGYLRWRRGKLRKLEPLPPPTRMDDFTTDEIVASFTDGFGFMLKSRVSDEYRQRSRNKLRKEHVKYLKVLRQEEKDLRRLDGLKDMSMDAIEERGRHVMKRIKSMPEIRGAAIRDKCLRLITHPLTGNRWKGKMSLAIWIPLDYQELAKREGSHDTPGGMYEDEIVVRTIDEKRKMLVRAPVDQLCLGSLRYSFDVNMLSGDWDMAVRVLLRAFRQRDAFAGYGKPLRTRATDLGYGVALEEK